MQRLAAPGRHYDDEREASQRALDDPAGKSFEKAHIAAFPIIYDAQVGQSVPDRSARE